MTTERKRWWRIAALAVVGGGVVTGGWYRFVRATPTEPADGEQTWRAAEAPAAPPPQVERAPEAAPPTGPAAPAGGIVSPPAPLNGGPATAVIPIVPVSGPPVAPPAVTPAAAMPAIPVPPVEPATGPRQPDAGLVPADKGAVPAIPPADFPAIPAPPKPQESKPATPSGDALPKPPAAAIPAEPPTSAPTVPPLLPGLPFPGTTAEPPKAMPTPPAVPAVPQPSEVTPSLPPVKPADPVSPMPPAKSDSGLNAPKPGNTLNLTVPALPPITLPGGGSGRETPGTTVDRAEPTLGASDKFVFPVPAVPNPLDSQLRDDAMHKLTATAAFAVLSGALLGAEQATAFPIIPPPSNIPMPGALVKADDKTDIAQLKKDLGEANKKIAALQEQVDTLTELLKGKKDDKGITLPSDPGAVAEIKQLKDKIATLQTELNSLKSQTSSLKPSVGTPETKPTGTVKIINEYPVEISIVVNDKSYRVAPSKVLDVEVPAGDFTYQLLTAGAQATKSVIQKGETVRLRIK